MILKRILTRKSILGFGYSDVRDLSVQMLIDSGRQNVLINSYFNLEKIGFIEDVLDELGITEEYRIEKPGKNMQLGKEFFQNRWSNMSDQEKMVAFNKQKTASKHNLGRRNSRSIGQRGLFLQAKNHGKR